MKTETHNDAPVRRAERSRPVSASREGVPAQGLHAGNGSTPREAIEIGLLTGGFDKPYAFGLAMALLAQGLHLDYIGSDEVDDPELHATDRLRFLNLRGHQRPNTGLANKVSRILLYYARLIRYACVARPRVFHLLWNNKFDFFDRTLLMLYYKLCGKKIVFTAHNVNAGVRDGKDGVLNRLTLKIQYRLADHIFVHTDKMKEELQKDFGVHETAITVIPFGINNAVPHTDLTPAEARSRLGIRDGEKTILFFGTIRPYKGLEYLVTAFQQLADQHADYRLIIAGEPKRDCEKYIADIQTSIRAHDSRDRITQRIEFVPDDETELYFKAADVVVLPYTEIFQSGVLCLGYSFGLPVIAADVGSLREDILEGRTGLVCPPRDPAGLARTIETYFQSDLYRTLDSQRRQIQEYARARYSWEVVGQKTRDIYTKLLGPGTSGRSRKDPS